MNDAVLKIDLSEPFEHLPHAPIVEAVIHWQARAEKKLDPDAFLAQLKEKLKDREPDYQTPQRQQEVNVGAEIGPDEASLRQRHTWHGYRFESADKQYVAQFKPYEDWEKFEAEAKRLWSIYRELAEPSEVQRLGVRFINVLSPVEPNRLAELLAVPPRSPDGFTLPLKGFMHQSTFEIPGHPYNLKVIQTIQPAGVSEQGSYNLIFDLDVLTTGPTSFDDVDNRLLQMQWIKNRAFFSFFKPDAIAKFREQAP
jgi:uncharacterized protein (TIGR04255 family)